MQITACPATLRACDLDEELRIIAIGKIIRGFVTPRECSNRLIAAGVDIACKSVSIAIQRECSRKRMAGERPAVCLDYAPPPGPNRHGDWSAVFDGYDAADPIGRGATALEAIMDLFEQSEDRHAAA